MVSPKNSFLDWDTTAGNNTDVGGIGILGTNAVNNFDDALRTIMAQLRAGVDGEVVYATKSGNYTALATDNNAVHRYTAAATVTLTAAATLGANWHYTATAAGGDVTIDPNGSETIDGLTTILVPNGTSRQIICDGTAFYTSLSALSKWELIGDYTLSAASQILVTNIGGFRNIRIRGCVIVSSAANISLVTSSNNGSSYDTGASDYSFQNISATGTTIATTSSSSSVISFTNYNSADTTGYCQFEMMLENFNIAQFMKTLSRSSFLLGGVFYIAQSASQRNQATARNAMKIFVGSGSLTGSITIEGIRG